jgi:hypothetical protein
VQLPPVPLRRGWLLPGRPPRVLLLGLPLRVLLPPSSLRRAPPRPVPLLPPGPRPLPSPLRVGPPPLLLRLWWC